MNLELKAVFGVWETPSIESIVKHKYTGDNLKSREVMRLYKEKYWEQKPEKHNMCSRRRVRKAGKERETHLAWKAG